MTQDEINARYDVLLEELIANGDIDANTSSEETAAIMRSVYPCSDEQWYYYAAYCAATWMLDEERVAQKKERIQ